MDYKNFTPIRYLVQALGWRRAHPLHVRMIKSGDKIIGVRPR